MKKQKKTTKKLEIKFGTDGWRAKIAKEFTFQNVQLVTQALVDYLFSKGTAKKGIAIGYDNRFESEYFARTAAEICSGAGIKTHLTQTSVTSPIISFAVNNQKLAAGIMITASHNPAEWNGFKIKEEFGGSSLPSTTQAVEANIKDKLKISPSTNNIEILDPRPSYLAKIKSLVDLERIKKSKIKMIADPMHGSAAGLFEKLGLPVIEIHGQRDPLFGGVNPEPLPINLTDTFSAVAEIALENPSDLSACVVLDGDGDRVAAVDSSGKFINTHNVFVLLLHHLIVNRKMSGDIVKTFNMSNLIDKLCAKHGRKLFVTPIGFKHIAEKMLKEDILLGGEESGGMGIKGFIPERDGILAGLMLFELMAYENKSLGQILDEIMQELGYFYYDRADIHTIHAKKIVSQLAKSKAHKFAGKKVVKIETLDGLKFNFKDDGWILFRASGTEPLLRIYVEARSEEDVKQILGAGEELIKS
ncbi:MAG: phosphoglucomutase/phosphomannomutase family protein [Candidatus Saganbacteria bacterium]|nr:phosphoglucomutase/phosphomannomutase family protein [Candidatus Saganbacteria bacterium]